MRRVIVGIIIWAVIVASVGCSNRLQHAAKATVVVNVYALEDSVEDYLGHGSGYVVHKSGYIITNAHVVEGTEVVKIKLHLMQREEIVAKVIGVNHGLDIAVLKIVTKHKLSVLKFGNSDKVRVGDKVTAIGYPYRLDKTVTQGIVQGLRGIGNPAKGGFLFQIQHGAAINGGNSGGPLLNEAGEVIGMNNAIPTYTGHFNGYAVAIPSNLIKIYYESVIKKHTKIRKGC